MIINVLYQDTSLCLHYQLNMNRLRKLIPLAAQVKFAIIAIRTWNLFWVHKRANNRHQIVCCLSQQVPHPPHRKIHPSGRTTTIQETWLYRPWAGQVWVRSSSASRETVRSAASIQNTCFDPSGIWSPQEVTRSLLPKCLVLSATKTTLMSTPGEKQCSNPGWVPA